MNIGLARQGKMMGKRGKKGESRCQFGLRRLVLAHLF